MSQLTICLAIFVVTLVCFALATKYVSLTVLSLISMAAMMVTGCLDPKDALGCFSNSNAILMASMFIVSAGLNRTQMVNKISGFFARGSHGSYTKVLAG